MAETQWQGIFTRLLPERRKELQIKAASQGRTVSEHVRHLIDADLGYADGED